LGDDEAVEMSDLSVLTVVDNGRNAVSRDLREAQRDAAQALSRAGCDVKEVQFEGLAEGFNIWASMLGMVGGETFRGLLTQGRGGDMRLKFLRYLVGRSPHTFPALALAAIENLTKLSPARVRRFGRMASELAEELLAALGPRGVMLFPPYSRPAPRHHYPVLTPMHAGYTAIFNVLELPVTQVPLGLNRDGLPLGVQVISAHGNDHLTIAVARCLERALGGWVPPPPLRSMAAPPMAARSCD